MHHNSSATYMTVLNHLLPSPEYTGDSDSDTDITHELERKRRQLDEDVARFRVQKDKEFRDFEVELKARRRQTQPHKSYHRDNAKNYYEFTKNSPLATPPASMLSGCEKKMRSPQTKHGHSQSEPIRLMKTSVRSKVTHPTLCLDKMNIKGENISQSHANLLQHPPVPALICATAATRPSRDMSQGCTSSKSTLSELPRDTPLLISEEKKYDDALSGLFVPKYLPLLDAQYDQHRTIEETQTQPPSPTEPSMSMESLPLQSTSLPTESSMTDSFQLPTTKRAYTSPSTINRKTLAPIIRNVNDNKRTDGKRKRVTFQLADRAIVEPRSSYEEGSSPRVANEGERRVSDESIVSNSSQEDSPRPGIQRRITPLDPFGRRKRDITPEDTPDSEVGMSMGDLLYGADKELENLKTARPSDPSDKEVSYFSTRHSNFSPTDPSPERSVSFGSVDEDAYISKRKARITHQRLERENSKSPNSSPDVSRQNSCKSSNTSKALEPIVAEFNHSHRSLPSHSSALRAHHRNASYPGVLEGDLFSTKNNVGFFELDEELDSPDAGLPKPDLADDKDEDLEMRGPRRSRGNQHEASTGIQTGTSVPINIVKTGSWGVSNSWMGTFGH